MCGGGDGSGRFSSVPLPPQRLSIVSEHRFVARICVCAPQGGAAMLAKGGGPGGGAWRVAATALTQGLRNLGLSQFATRELLVLENELEVG